MSAQYLVLLLLLLFVTLSLSSFQTAFPGWPFTWVYLVSCLEQDLLPRAEDDTLAAPQATAMALCSAGRASQQPHGEEGK